MQITKKEPTEGQSFEKKMYCGIERFELVAVNPTIKELNKLYDREDKDDDKELEYVTQTTDGDDKVKITIYLRSLDNHRITQKSFFITDKERMNKNGDKYQYINQVCGTTWVDSEKNLPEFFTKFLSKEKKVLGDKSFRIAKEGEGDFYEFLRAIGNGINWFSEQTDIEFNFKKLLKEDFKQLQSVLLDKVENYFPPFAAISYIKTVPNDDGTNKEYNEIFTKAIIPMSLLSKLNLSFDSYYNQELEKIKSSDELFSELGIEGIKETLTINDIYGYVAETSVALKTDYERKSWDRIITEINSEYGIKGFYKVCPVFEYKPSMNILATNTTLSTSGSDY